MGEQKINDPTDYADALADPSAVFSSPEELIALEELTVHQKIELLRRWAYDEDELAVAEEEGMKSIQPSMLRRILLALEKLGVEIDSDHTPPTKQGALVK